MSDNTNNTNNTINGIDTTGLHPDTIAALRKYSRPSEATTAPHQNWELSKNGRARAQEQVQQWQQRTGKTREEARQDPGMLMQATLRALAEQRGAPPRNAGIDGRNGLGREPTRQRTSRSLAEMAAAQKPK